MFSSLGYFCAKRPLTVIFLGLALCLALSSGFFYFKVITDPVELWSPKQSTTRLNKNYFDSHFAPFYRTTQLIIRATNDTKWAHELFGQNTKEYSPVLKIDFLKQALDLELALTRLTGMTAKNETVRLDDICYKPLDNTYNCTIQSIFEYWQTDPANLDKVHNNDFGLPDADWISHFETCVDAPTNTNDSIGLSCLGDYGGTVMPFVSLGGYPSPSFNKHEYGNATALLITFIINNHKDEALNEKAEAWEKAVIDYMKVYKNENMTISFSTERSIQDELNRESQSDILTILISYMAMFFYVAVMLGNYSNVLSAKSLFGTLMVTMKIGLGLTGVLIVILSVTASIGLFSFMGVEATLIIFEVIYINNCFYVCLEFLLFYYDPRLFPFWCWLLELITSLFWSRTISAMFVWRMSRWKSKLDV